MHALYGDRKQKLLENHPDRLVEIGPGIGANFRYYRPGTEVIAVEPNQMMHARLRQRAEKHGMDLQIVGAGIERSELESEQFQMVVSTLVLCSVSDPVRSLSEVRRLLSPGGRFVFLEHEKATESRFNRFVQQCVRHPWRWFFQGCHVDRDLQAAITAADFERLQIDQFTIRPSFIPFAPHVAGVAFV